MTKQIRVNISSIMNTAAVRKEKRNGRDIVIVPSATLPDNVIMNRIKYTAEEIGKSFALLEGTIAPLGHPMVNGKYVSAKDPQGLNVGYIGAWNENVRRKDGRVYLDKVIDVQFANQSEGGKAVLDAIEKGGPIHTSTGVYCMLKAAEAEDHDFEARNMVFDHDAILMGEAGAATPDQGVGMMVNGDQVAVINSSLSRASDDLDWSIESVFSALDRVERAGKVDRFKNFLIELFKTENLTQTNGADQMADEKDTKAMLDGIAAMNATLASALEAMTANTQKMIDAAVAPLVEAQATITANAAAKDKAELDGLVEKIVASNLMDKDAAAELTLNAARALAPKAAPGKAYGLNSALPKAEGTGFKLPEGDK